jgi:hypothetical protein
MARKLRIAVSVFFGLLTVALCVLWVRSYWRMDAISVNWTNATVTSVCSEFGAFTISHMDQPIGKNRLDLYYWGWATRNGHVVSSYRHSTALHDSFVWVWKKTGFRCCVIPHCVLVLATLLPLCFMYVPAIRQFSLRTMLIATTLVAVVLGIAVWATR